MENKKETCNKCKKETNDFFTILNLFGFRKDGIYCRKCYMKLKEDERRDEK